MKNHLTFNDPDTDEKLEDQYETMVHQVNTHCYIVSLNKLDQDAKYHCGKSTLTDIHKDFNCNKENLVNNHGAVHIKEFTLDRYKCRCHEHHELLDTKTMDSKLNL